MKKVLKTLIILVLFMLFILVSCGGTEKTKYTCYFCVDGEAVATLEIEEGAPVSYPNIVPTKEGNKEYSYVFKEWVSEDGVTNIYQPEVFEAKFDRIRNKYTIKFVDYDDSVLLEEEVEYNKVPQEPKKYPERVADNDYKYYFKGWDKQIVRVTEDTTYKATYRLKEIKHFTTLKGLKLSILGDSITTFYTPTSPVNTYNIQDGQYYYPVYCQSINTYDKTWWGQFYLKNEMVLGLNNAWSGSTAYGTGESAGMSDSRINTLIKNGDPDIIIVFLGANDCASIYTDQWNTDTYRIGIETIIRKINKISDADIFFIDTWGRSTFKEGKYVERAKEFNAVLNELAEAYDCTVIPISEYITTKNEASCYNDNLHFSLTGATLLSKVVEKHIKEHYGIPYDGDLK